MRVDTTSRPIDIGADSIKPGRPAHRVEREMLAANPIDHHARDRVDAVVSAAALRTPAMDGGCRTNHPQIRCVDL
jgi:hypothetical protein